MSAKMRTRKMKNGEFYFPKEWVELNSEEAKDKSMVVFVCEKNRCAVYYSLKEAKDLNREEVRDIHKLAVEFGFTDDANIYGYITAGDIKNVGNARFIKKEEEKND